MTRIMQPSTCTFGIADRDFPTFITRRRIWAKNRYLRCVERHGQLMLRTFCSKKFLEFVRCLRRICKREKIKGQLCKLRIFLFGSLWRYVMASDPVINSRKIAVIPGFPALNGMTRASSFGFRWARRLAQRTLIEIPNFHFKNSKWRYRQGRFAENFQQIDRNSSFSHCGSLAS